MAPTNPAFVLQNRTDHPAQLYRMMLAGVNPGPMAALATSPVGGVSPYFGNRMFISGNAAMTVTAQSGLVFMPGSTAWQGLYAGYNTTNYTVTVPAASSTQYRSDYIAAVQSDTAFGGATDTWDIIDVEGAFSSVSPGTLPSLPNNAVPLAIIRVTPNMTVTNGGGTIVDARTWANLGGPLFATSNTRPPTNSPAGTMWVETDTNRLGVILNSAYNYLDASPTMDYERVFKTTDETVTNSTTLQNDNQLVLPYEANGNYAFRAWIDYEGANVGTGDLKFSFSGVTSGSFLKYNAIYQSLTGTYSPVVGAAVNTGSTTPAAGTNGSGNPVAFAMHGALAVGSTGGNLQFQWAQNTANSTATTVHALSWMELVRIS
jgi:hypothetical protein